MTAVGKFTNMKLQTVARDIVPVTPNDSTDLTSRAFGLLIGGTAGDVVIRTGLSGTTSRTIAVAANQYLMVEVVRVLSTGTTATPIYALVADNDV